MSLLASRRGKQPPSKQEIFILLIWMTVFVAGSFRFFHLPQKFFWSDEIASALRIAGLTAEDLSKQVHSRRGQVITATDLRRLVQQNPQSRPGGLIHSLAKDDAQHPPLIPLLQYGWVRMFGPDPVSARFVSALFGILSLGLIFWLALEVTGNSMAASLSTLLFSVSPLQLIYAQQTREYSAWVAMILLMTIAFLRAARRNRAWDWILYAGSVSLAMYTYVTSFAVVAAYGLCVLQTPHTPKLKKPFFISTTVAMATFSPWLWTIVTHLDVIKNQMIIRPSPFPSGTTPPCSS